MLWLKRLSTCYFENNSAIIIPSRKHTTSSKGSVSLNILNIFIDAKLRFSPDNQKEITYFNYNLRKRCMQTLQTLQRLRVGTERVRSWYGAGLVLIEELINESYGFILLLVYDLGIYLCCGYARVSKQLAGGVYVCPQRKHHRGEGMSGSME